MKSTYRIPVVSAVTLGLLFCATPAVATPTLDPAPSETTSSSAPVADNAQSPIQQSPETHDSASLSDEGNNTDPATAQPQDQAPTELGTPLEDTSPTSSPAPGSDPTDVTPLEQGPLSFEQFSEPADLEPFSQEFADLDDDEFWALIDGLAPEGSEYWDDEQWEAFFETPAGQVYLDEIEELLDTLFPEDTEEWDDEEWEAYLAELEAYLAQLEAIFPEGSENWDDAQWEAFLLTPEGEAFLDEFLAFLLQDLDEAEREELLAFFDALFEELMVILQEEGLLSDNSQSTPPASTPAAETDIQPAAATKTSTATEASLAETGSNGAGTLAGLGILLFLVGTGVLVGQRRLQARKTTTRH